MSAPERIYLQPECCATDSDVGRLWCEDPDPVECEDGRPWTEYVRADLAALADENHREEDWAHLVVCLVDQWREGTETESNIGFCRKGSLR